MASLRLKFPEKDEPTVIVLTGARVTLGRLPLNTIQIIDRTLSGFHAEFVLEEDHYRLHDRGSTNGTFVNGDSVTDFHLREACKIAFGSLECDFSPESAVPAESANVEALPTRSEINAVRQENAELKNRVESLREELDTLRQAPAARPGVATVDKEEFEKVVVEREKLMEAQHALEEELARLKTDLAVLQRDRENLKKVAESAKAEFASLGSEAPPVEPPAAEVPADAVPPTPPAVAAPAEPELALSETPAEPAKPAPSFPAPVPRPKPSFALPVAVKTAPKPPDTLPTAPINPPTSPGSGIRAVPVATPALKPIAIPARPSAGEPQVRPLPKPVLPTKKGGTQKIELDAVQPLKPPMKLPLQPTVKLSGTPMPRPTPLPPKKDADEK